MAASAALLAACARSADVPPPSEASAEDAPVHSPTTTAPPPPALERIGVDAFTFGGPGDQRLLAVATGNTSVVAVGDDGGRPAIWRSPEGITWERVDLSSVQFPAGARVLDVAAAPEGFYAVGTAAGGPAAWESPDGLVWRRSDVPGTGVVEQVVHSELGLTALGHDGSGAVAAWFSFDGSTWEGADLEPHPGRVVGAVAGGPGVLALLDRDDTGPELWGTDDGMAWAVEPPTGPGVLPAGGTPVPGALLAAGSTIVAAGAVDDPDGTDAAILSSVGGPFERVSHSETTFGGDGAQRVRALTQDGSQLVAVGTDTLDTGDIDAVLWTSGAQGWQRAPGGEGLVGPGDQVATDVTTAGEDVVAVGWERTAAGIDAVAWALTTQAAEEVAPVDGPVPAWQRAPAQDDLGSDGVQSMAAVAAGGPGVVAVGSDADEGAVWGSSDAAEWTRLATVGPGALLGVAAGPPGLVAVGTDGSGAAAWASPDAETWVGASLGSGVARSVAASAELVVAVGDDAGSAVAWSSGDGRTWERVVLGPGAAAAVVFGDGGFVAVGGGTAWSSPDGRTWAPTALGAGSAAGVGVVPGGPLFATGSLGDDATAWLLAGAAWSPSDPPGLAAPATQQALGAAGGEGLLLAVGRTDLGGGDDAATWASEDGLSWTRAPHDEDLFGGDLAQRMAGVVIVDGTAVAVGSSGDDAAVWFAPQAAAGGAASNL
jgi:hypothetical protein